MINPDWIQGLLGGLMIGFAAAGYLLVNGRIMGASGLLGSVVDGTAGRAWTERAALLAGLIVAPTLAVWLGFGAPHPSPAPIWLLVVAGALVGIGTRLANGCTSGHGVCGISRLSRRGIVATMVYLLAGVAGVAITRLFDLGANG